MQHDSLTDHRCSEGDQGQQGGVPVPVDRRSLPEQHRVAQRHTDQHDRHGAPAGVRQDRHRGPHDQHGCPQETEQRHGVAQLRVRERDPAHTLARSGGGCVEQVGETTADPHDPTEEADRSDDGAQKDRAICGVRSPVRVPRSGRACETQAECQQDPLVCSHAPQGREHAARPQEGTRRCIPAAGRGPRPEKCERQWHPHHLHVEHHRVVHDQCGAGGHEQSQRPRAGRESARPQPTPAAPDRCQCGEQGNAPVGPTMVTDRGGHGRRLQLDQGRMMSVGVLAPSTAEPGLDPAVLAHRPCSGGPHRCVEAFEGRTELRVQPPRSRGPHDE